MGKLLIKDHEKLRRVNNSDLLFDKLHLYWISNED